MKCVSFYLDIFFDSASILWRGAVKRQKKDKKCHKNSQYHSMCDILSLMTPYDSCQILFTRTHRTYMHVCTLCLDMPGLTSIQNVIGSWESYCRLFKISYFALQMINDGRNFLLASAIALKGPLVVLNTSPYHGASWKCPDVFGNKLLLHHSDPKPSMCFQGYHWL